MKKKIQLSTVRQEADVEVIYVNAALICKVINAHNSINQIINEALGCCIRPQSKPKMNENGDVVADENGFVMEEPVLDKNGNQIIEYDSYHMSVEQLRSLHQVVLPFLAELRNTLEGE
jgi:starvation-inducible outer membrane lipoprotein